MSEPQWLAWARRIQAIAQTGQHYTENPYDRERYDMLAALAAEIVSAHEAALSTEALLESIWNDERGYATPKVDVRGFVLNADGEVLLVRENLDSGRWTLPGGWADVNVTPSENCAREVLEEAGYLVDVGRLLAIYDRRLHGHPPTLFHIYKLFFACTLTQPDPVPSPQGDLESSEARWFAERELPPADELSLGRVTPSQLTRFFAMVRDGVLQPDVD
jgi:ADP-ribose pyrophosphatase YjhB (NUDIX family)